MENPTILIDVDSDGIVQVYWHDTEESGRVAPEISVIYYSDRVEQGLSKKDAQEMEKMIDDHDSMIEAEWGTEQIF